MEPVFTSENRSIRIYFKCTAAEKFEMAVQANRDQFVVKDLFFDVTKQQLLKEEIKDLQLFNKESVTVFDSQEKLLLNIKRIPESHLYAISVEFTGISEFITEYNFSINFNANLDTISFFEFMDDLML